MTITLCSEETIRGPGTGTVTIGSPIFEMRHTTLLTTFRTRSHRCAGCMTLTDANILSSGYRGITNHPSRSGKPWKRARTTKMNGWMTNIENHIMYASLLPILLAGVR